MGRIILNLLILPFAIIGGYFVSYNPFKIQYRIANRFYPGHLSAFNVFCSIIIISLYLGELDYIAVKYIVNINYDKIEFKQIQFIIYYVYSIIPIGFIALFFNIKYGKIMVLYNTTKPTSEELKKDIINKSQKIMIKKDKIIIISLCRYYLKTYGMDHKVNKVLMDIKN